MGFKAEASGEKRTTQNGFYLGKVVEVSAIRERLNNPGWEWDITFDSKDLPFNIKKRVFIDPEFTWKVDLIMKAGGCEPIAVTETESGKKVNEWSETDLLDKELVAYVYQNEYAEIWDFLPADADDAEKTQVQSRFLKYWNKKQNGENNGNGVSTNAMTPVETAEVTGNSQEEEDDLPF